VPDASALVTLLDCNTLPGLRLAFHSAANQRRSFAQRVSGADLPRRTARDDRDLADTLDRGQAIGNHPPVLRCFGRVLLITALVSVIGGHWAILQSIAWTNMLADNLRTDGFTRAVAKTFDGEHPCRMCKAISQERQAEKKPDTLDLKVRKLDLASKEEQFTFMPPTICWLVPGQTFAGDMLSHPPLLPPPRQRFA